MQYQLGLGTLLRLQLAGEDLTPLLTTLLERANHSSNNDAAAMLDAAILFEFRGNPEVAANLRGEALKLCRHYRIIGSQETRLRVLALVAPGPIMANVPLECLLQESDIQLDLFYAVGDEPATIEIPDHDLLFVAIGESAVNAPILHAWQPHLDHWPRPLVNRPERILQTARDLAHAQLEGLPGVVSPAVYRWDRAALQAALAAPQQAAGLGFPCLVRPVDSHAGKDLTKIDAPGALADWLAATQAAAVFVSPFVDYRSADGLFRKYRIVLVEGEPYAVHMALSQHWMVHYLNADMAESPDKRAAEARFMRDFDQDFAARHRQALDAIQAALGLDYLGIDCAETADGRLLIFEVDPAMVVHMLDPVDLYPYKPATIQRVFDAFRAMLWRAAGLTPSRAHEST